MAEKLDIGKTSKLLAGAIRVGLSDENVDDVTKAEALLWYLIDWFGTDPQLAKKIDARTWGHLSVYAGESMDSILVNQLHKLHRHPEYEYASSESGRKQGGGDAPEGFGWEINTYLEEGRKTDDFDRGDFTDTQWYRRKLSDRDKDEVNPFEGPKITLDRIDLHDVLKLVAAHVNKGYFPMASLPSYEGFELAKATERLTTTVYLDKVQSTFADIQNMRRPEFNSKPEYISRGGFVNNLSEGANCWNPSWDYCVADDALITPNVKADEKSMYYYIELPEADILINLNKPFTESFIRVNLKGGDQRGSFKQWAHFSSVSVNPFALEKRLETIG